MNYMLFILCLIQIESSNNNNAIGDNGKAVGCLQIHPIMVREVNRICRIKRSKMHFTIADRMDRTKSITMATIYFRYHIKNLENYEAMARSWNGGPGWRQNKASTDRYWAKVKSEMSKEKYALQVTVH